MAVLDFTPPIIAHRGASAYAPENTMAAFVKAAQLGIKWVEFDVVLAKCGMPIIFHDETLDRTTNAVGDIDAFSYAHLQTLDAGRWFHSSFSSERIPTLHEVLVFLRDAGMSANVEIKPMPGKEEQTVMRTLEVMEELGWIPRTRRGMTASHGGMTPSHGGSAALSSRGVSVESMSNVDRTSALSSRGLSAGSTSSVSQILFSSFSIPTLRYLRKHSSDCNIGLLLEKWEPNWEAVCDELQCVSVHTDEVIINAETAKKVKNMNRYLLCYTINNPARALELFDFGVDAVFSDCPDVLERELANG
jgi:glycerophosphoryl diester phosphodiesterase